MFVLPNLRVFLSEIYSILNKKREKEKEKKKRHLVYRQLFKIFDNMLLNLVIIRSEQFIVEFIKIELKFKILANYFE